MARILQGLCHGSDWGFSGDILFINELGMNGVAGMDDRCGEFVVARKNAPVTQDRMLRRNRCVDTPRDRFL